MSTKKGNNRITLEEFIEEQRKFNTIIDKQNKKIKKIIVFMIAFSLILSGITGVASYTLAANDVGYTAKDTTWQVENTQEAIDELRDILGASLVGSIFSYMGTTPPTGYLSCNGTVYNIADYPRLAEHIKNDFGKYNYFGGNGTTTFAVPDLRGEFLRGTGTNSHTYGGSGAAVGVHQSPTRSPYIISGSNRLSVLSTATIYDPDSTQGNSKLNYTNASSATTNSYPNFYSSRPTNTSVLYIIKY